VAIVMRDVTEQKEAERSLKLFRTLIDQSNDAVEVIDPKTLRFLDVNEKACKDLGYAREELLSMTVLDIDSNADDPCHAAVMRELLASGFVVKEAVHRRKDGSTLPVETSLKYVPLDKNYVVAVSRDISERKHAADVLRESQQRLTGIIASAMDAIITVDEQQRIVLFNAAAEKMFRCPEEEAMGHLIDRFIPQPFRAAHSGHIRHFGETGVTNRAMGNLGALWAVRADGEEFQIEASISQIESGGKKLFTVILRDVTERKQAEAERERLAAVVDSSDDAIIGENLDGTITAWNRAAERLFGYSSAEAVGKPILMLLPPERASEEADILARIKRGESVEHFETVRVRKDGKRIEVSATISPIKYIGGAVIGASKIARDITERKHAEQLLRESEKNYRTLFESMDEGFCTIEVLFDENNKPMDYRFLDVNPAFGKQTGIPDARGRRMREIAPQHEEHWFEIYGKIALTGEPARFENEAAQLHRWYDVHAFRVGEPQARQVAIFFLDITERRLSEEALRSSEERFSKAFRASPVAITISTQAEGRYLDVNDAFLEMVGRKRAEVIGRTAEDLNFWAERSQRVEMLRHLEESGRVTGLRTQNKTSTGEIREADVSAELIELEGQTCVLAITRDITETLKLETQFRQAQKMEAVGRLAGGVAHDFNNLLGVIIGYSDLSLPMLAPESKANRYMDQIKKASHRAVGLTRQLLAFSRQQVVFPKILDLNEVVHNVTTMLQRLVGEDVAMSFRPTVPIGLINGDPGQIEQILMNLVVNARDAMPGGGEIIIETGHAELDEHYVFQHPGSHAGQHIVLSVSDTGCGMDEKIKAQIFEPFFTTKGIGQGTGLGLSTVYGIVKQGGGTIFVYSEPGKGTTFKIYLPRVEGKAEQLAQSHTEADFPGGSETILVVEDDLSLRELTVSMLQATGYRVIEAGNAEAALDIVKASEPGIDLLLTDVIMPGKSGVELVGLAKAIRPNLRSLFVSGYTGDVVALRGGLIPEAAFLEKPFTRSSLLKKIRSALHSGQ
jgi:PAS domain S-box-containing protein